MTLRVFGGQVLRETMVTYPFFNISLKDSTPLGSFQLEKTGMKNPSFDPDLDAQLADAMAAADNEDMDLASAIAPDGDMPAISIGAKSIYAWQTRRERFLHSAALGCEGHRDGAGSSCGLAGRCRSSTYAGEENDDGANHLSCLGGNRIAGQYERETILKHLRLIPSVLKLEERPRGYTRYQAVLGDGWTAS